MSRPAAAVRATALGTAFDVRLGDTETDVTVTRHAVLVEFPKAEKAPLRVGEGQQAAYDHVTYASELKASDSLVALAWRRGQLVVDDAPLSYLVEEMNRRFSGRIVIANAALSQRRVSGTFAMSDTQASLTYLEQALRLTVTKLGPIVIVR